MRMQNKSSQDVHEKGLGSRVRGQGVLLLSRFLSLPLGAFYIKMHEMWPQEVHEKCLG